MSQLKSERSHLRPNFTAVISLLIPQKCTMQKQLADNAVAQSEDTCFMQPFLPRATMLDLATASQYGGLKTLRDYQGTPKTDALS
jgi:hypothetical protein